MSRFELTGHDRYRVDKAREELAALTALDMGDDRAMARTLGRLEVALQQMVEMVDQAERPEEPAGLPVFGPTELQNANDDTGPAVAVVRVDFQMSREELATAFAYGYAETNQDRPVEDMSVEDVRADVEGYLASTGYLQFSQHVEDMRAGTPASPAVQAAFEAALERAYPSVTALAPPAVQAPVYGPGTVTLQTLDRGEVVVDEPAWCVGHDGEPVGYRADVTHNGAWTAAGVDVDGDRVEFLRARISHAPLTEAAIEPHPVADVEDVGALDVEQLRALAAETGLHAGRLYSKANELDRLRRDEA